MMDALAAAFLVFLALVVVGALVLIGGFLVSMIVAAFYVPIESISRHRHHPGPA